MEPETVLARVDRELARPLSSPAVGAGLVLAGVGTYLWLSAPEEDGAGTALTVQPDVAASGLSIGTETRW